MSTIGGKESDGIQRPSRPDPYSDPGYAMSDRTRCPAAWLRGTLVAAVSAVSLARASDTPDPRAAVLAKADRDLYEHRYEEAANAYEDLVRSRFPACGAQCRMNLGYADLMTRRFARALQVYSVARRERVPTEADVEAKRLAEGRRAGAQWGIAVGLVGLGRYRHALRALQDLETKYPVHTQCGNGAAQDHARRELYRGLIFEHLGNYRSAIESYLFAAHASWGEGGGNWNAAMRLAEIYEATGQAAASADFARTLPIAHPLRKAVEMKELERLRERSSLRPALEDLIEFPRIPQKVALPTAEQLAELARQMP